MTVSPAAFRRPCRSRKSALPFVLKDSASQKLGYFYYEEDPGRCSSAKLLNKDEAGRIAANVAKRRSCCVRVEEDGAMGKGV